MVQPLLQEERWLSLDIAYALHMMSNSKVKTAYETIAGYLEMQSLWKIEWGLQEIYSENY